MMELTFLGTSCMVPTKERNVQGIFLSYKNEGILIDCGEGTQRQMNIAGINRNKVTRILISHWHGDHVSGLLGLIQTIGNGTPDKTLHIYGPKGSKEKLGHLMQSCYFDVKIDIKLKESWPKKKETILDTEDFYIEAMPLDHKIPCLGYRFVEKNKRRINMAKAKKLGIKEGPELGKIQQGKPLTINGKTIDPDTISSIQKGKKIAFILDTAVCNSCYDLAEDVDILISEAAYHSSLEEKAEQHKHMTAKSAAMVAAKAGVKKLIITHLSQRYKTPEEVLADAKEYFENTEVAYDFMKVKL